MEKDPFCDAGVQGLLKAESEIGSPKELPSTLGLMLSTRQQLITSRGI